MMNGQRTLVGMGLALAATASAVPQVAGGQAATPPAGVSVFAEAPPSPAECWVDPAPDGDLVPGAAPDFGGFPVPDIPPDGFGPGPVATADLFGPLPPASARDRAEVETLERIWAACWNRGDFRRVMGLWTHDAVRRFARDLAVAGEDPADFADGFFDGAQPIDRIDWLPVRVDAVLQAGNDRLVAVVDFCDVQQIHYLRLEGGLWRVDRLEELPLPETTCFVNAGVLATPVHPPGDDPRIPGPLG